MKKLCKILSVISAATVAAGGFALAGCAQPSADEVISKALEASRGTEYRSMDFSAGFSIDIAQGGIVQTVTADMDGKIDFSEYGADLQVGYTQPGYSREYGYLFIRDYTMFASDTSYASPVDTQGMVLQVASTLLPQDTPLQDTGSESSQTGSTSWASVLGSILTSSDAAASLGFVSLADKYGAVTVEDDSLTIDMVAFIGAMYEGVGQLIESLTDDTTLAEVYSSGIVSDLLSSVYIADEQLAYLVSLVNSSSGAALLPEPEEGQGLYEYIGALLKDEQFGAAAGLDGAIGDVKFIDCIQGITGDYSITMRQIQAMYAAAETYVFMEDGSFVIDLETTRIELNDCKLRCRLNDDGALCGEDISLALSAEGGGQSVEFEMNMSADYSAEAAALADIGNNLVKSSDGYSTVDDYLASVAG